MTETPTEEATPKSRSAYLPVLPDDWSYCVRLTGPEGQRIEIEPTDGEPYEQNVTVVTGFDLKGFQSETLADAVKVAAKTVRTLRDLAAHEKKANEAREQLLAAIGAPSPQQETTPGTLSGVNVVSSGGQGVRLGTGTKGTPAAAKVVDDE